MPDTPESTALNLDAIEARLAEITPGPWRVGQHPTGHLCILWPHSKHGSVAKLFCDFDADFIAHARTDVPALVAEVRLLRTLTLRCVWCQADHATLAALRAHTEVCPRHPVAAANARIALLEAEVERLSRAVVEGLEDDGR